MNEVASSEIISGLDNDVAILCLSKLSFSHHAKCRQVCKSWEMAVNSVLFQRLRIKNNLRQNLLCLCHGVSKVRTEPALLFSVFDPQNNTRRPLPPLFLKSFFPCAINFTEYEVVVSDSIVFVIGGTLFFPNSARRLNKQIWGFDTVTFAWSHYFNAPMGMHRFSAVSICKKIFMTGSFFHSSSYILDLTTGEFETAADLPEAGESTFFPSSGMRFQNQIIMIPQAPSIFGNRSAFIYDMCQNAWTKHDEFWPQNGSLNCCQAMGVLRGKLYGIKGGKSNAQDSTNTKVIMWDENSWVEIALLPSQKYSSDNISNTCRHFMNVMDGKLHILEVVDENTCEKRSSCYMHILDIVEKGKYTIPRLVVFNACISDRGIQSCSVIAV